MIVLVVGGGCLDVVTAPEGNEGRLTPTDYPVLVSHGMDGASANGRSIHASVSADAAVVVYETNATNVFPADRIACPPDSRFDVKVSCSDVVVWHRGSGGTRLLSQAGDGRSGRGDSRQPFVADDGNVVVFESAAPDLVPGDTNEMTDVFVARLTSRELERVNVATNGSEAQWQDDPADRTYGSACRYGCDHPSLSPGGDLVLFDSWSSNLVADDTNRRADVFLRDLRNGTTVRASLSTGEREADGISGSWGQRSLSRDGRFVLFESTASNLVGADENSCPGLAPSDFHGPSCRDVFRLDRDTGDVVAASRSMTGGTPRMASWAATMSADGAVVVYQSSSDDIVVGDTNGQRDIFLWEAASRKTTRVTQTGEGSGFAAASRLPTISADGNRILFLTSANVTTGVSEGHERPVVYDRVASRFCHVALTAAGQRPDASVHDASLSPDGGWVVFSTEASNVVPRDTNGFSDVFLTRVSC